MRGEHQTHPSDPSPNGIGGCSSWGSPFMHCKFQVCYPKLMHLGIFARQFDIGFSDSGHLARHGKVPPNERTKRERSQRAEELKLRLREADDTDMKVGLVASPSHFFRAKRSQSCWLPARKETHTDVEHGSPKMTIPDDNAINMSHNNNTKHRKIQEHKEHLTVTHQIWERKTL